MTDESRGIAARVPGADAAHAVGDTARYLTFLLEGATYAIPVGHVLRVIDCRSVVRVIRAPRHQRGVLNYDGVVVPVLDLRRLLGIESVTRRPFSMVIVTRVPSDTGAEIVGFVVERVLAVTAERH